jgi:hypothetical protein
VEISAMDQMEWAIEGLQQASHIHALLQSARSIILGEANARVAAALFCVETKTSKQSCAIWANVNGCSSFL